MKKLKLEQKFFRFVFQNVLGMIGMSCYILADTYFISKAVGADGITALNLVLPIYNLIFAMGSMFGIGAAICFTIEKNKNSGRIHCYFFTSVILALAAGSGIAIVGLLFPAQIIRLLGGDAEITEIAVNYTRIFMGFAPFFMWNQIGNAFVRNDDHPERAMLATLVSSFFNIAFDYILMFPCKMGMEGAALATSLSPIVGIAISMTHLCSNESKVKLIRQKIQIKEIQRVCRVGVSALIGELSTGVITITFNLIILRLTGNIGVAAYGIVANLALVATAVQNGIAQGAQPIISEAYGKGNRKNENKIIRIGIITAVISAAVLYGVLFLSAPQITMIFNRDQDPVLALHAVRGIRLYFVGFLFAAVNITGISVMSSVEFAKEAFIISVLRGFVIILLCALSLSALFGMTGVWLSFAAAEAMTMVITRKVFRKLKNRL